MSTSDVRRIHNETGLHHEILNRIDQTAANLTHLQQEDLESRATTLSSVFEELHPDTAFLNRTYLQEVEARRLKVVPEILDWLGYRVRVFLRHDRNFVFAIAFRSSIGMANHVVLRNATFEVDDAGRTQTLEQRGPLANRTTVHAWITGTLNAVSNESPTADADMEPVIYKPAERKHFCRAADRSPLHCSELVQCVPGPAKVWVPRCVEPLNGGAL
ncbi:MAG: hypothetical protein U0996_05510 [Planctomycetaceae bacterium]